MNDYHVHTNQTDGEMTPQQVFALARASNIEVAFTEHISRKPSYNWFEFRDKIKEIDNQVLVGVEAKVLDPKGTLDVSNEILDEADLVLGSVHSIGTVEWLLQSKCDIIAHPQITQSNIGLFKKCPKILEINFKHRLPWEILDQLIEGNTFSFGSDTHTEADFVGAQSFFQAIMSRYKKINIWKGKK